MEFYGSHIIQVASEREEALLGLIVPDFDSVIITTTNEHGLGLMEVHSSHRTYIGNTVLINVMD